MKRYADPERCPGCASPIAYGAAACPACDLPLRGPVAVELFTTLTKADQLLATLRRTPVPQPVPVGAGAPRTTAPESTPGAIPAFPTERSSVTPSPARVKTSSVPVILLTLGAGCLLVAALVFLAFAWVLLDVGGRTAVLVGLTAAAAAGTWALSGRGLRGAVESVGLVTLGLVALDLAGARSAGWFGSPSDEVFAIVSGTSMALVAGIAARALRSRPTTGFLAGEIVAGLGVAVAAAGIFALPESAGPRFTFALAAATAATVALIAARLRVAGVVSGAVAVLTWIGLVAFGSVEALDHADIASLWGDLRVWPLLVAAVWAAGVALARALPQTIRDAAGSTAVALVVASIAMPATDEPATIVNATGLVIGAVAFAAFLLLPRRTAPLLALTGAAAAAVAALASAAQAGQAALLLADAAATAGSPTDRFAPALALAPWLLPFNVTVLVAGCWAVAAYAERSVIVDRDVAIWSLVVTGVLTLVGFGVPVVIVVAALALAGLGLVLRQQIALGSSLLLGGLLVAQHAEVLVLGAAALALTAVVLQLGRHRDDLVAGVAGPLVIANAAWAVGSLAETPDRWTAAVGLVVALLPAYAVRNVGLEVGGFLGAAALAVLGLESTAGSSVWAAVYLTLLGVAASAMALLRTDRRHLGWAGGLLLAAATWVRLADLGVTAPEPYTLPSAMALLGFGLWRLRRHGEESTLAALAPGLALALVPSLLWVLVEPATLRAAVLGVVCLALVLGGVAARWSAPLVAGAVVGAIVVLRHAGPYLDAGVPRWALIGAAGAILVGLGITWEQRVAEARRALGYVTSLR